MLLTALQDEFTFYNECRKRSPKTVKNYRKQIDYLRRFLEEEKGVTHIEDVEMWQIKEFLLTMTKAGRKANYVNDLLKAYAECSSLVAVAPPTQYYTKPHFFVGGFAVTVWLVQYVKKGLP